MCSRGFLQAKIEGRKLSMVTCYDYTFARMLSRSVIDGILVGDSAAMVMHVYGLLGRRDAALKLIRESRDEAMKGWSSGPVGIALIYLGLGDRESSLAWLETDYNVREGALPYVRLDPRFDPVGSDPRFVMLLRKMRLQRK